MDNLYLDVLPRLAEGVRKAAELVGKTKYGIGYAQDPREYHRVWYEENRERLKINYRENAKRYRANHKKELRARRFGNKCLNCNSEIEKRAVRCRSCNQKMRMAALPKEKKINSGSWKKGVIPWSKGKENPKMKGARNPAWKGGVTPKNNIIRRSSKMKEWRTAIFERDNYTCQECSIRSSKGVVAFLHADHIQPFAYFPELRFELSNGRTLCYQCHLKTPTWGERAKTLYELR